MGDDNLQAASVKNWVRLIQHEDKKLESQLVSLREVRNIVKRLFDDSSCPFSYFKIDIQHHDIVFSSEDLGVFNSEIKIKSIEDSLLDGCGDEHFCKIYYKAKENRNVLLHDWYPCFLDLLKSAWLPYIRHQKNGALDLKSGDVEKKLLNSLDWLSSDGCKVFCVYIDMDSLKKINDRINHESGNKALNQLASCIEHHSINHNVIVTNDGGDEFVLFIGAESELSILKLINKIRQCVKKLEFLSDKKGGETINPDFTSGIVCLDAWRSFSSIREHISRAESLTKKVDLNNNLNLLKKRGTVSLYQKSINAANKEVIGNKSAYEIAFSFVLQNRFVINPFSNVFLNFISDFVSDNVFNTANMQDEIKKVITWLNITIVPGVEIDEVFNHKDRCDEIKSFSLFFSIVHGLLKSKIAETSSVQYRLDKEYKTFEIKLDGVIIFSDSAAGYTFDQESYLELNIKTKTDLSLQEKETLLQSIILISTGEFNYKVGLFKHLFDLPRE